ncbi:hypothetical protein F5146DRAFT_1139015 [Armillaria mellea]|nr:hypothetical protein F5146DRAFT_1139015 [Armillaria mellea]
MSAPQRLMPMDRFRNALNSVSPPVFSTPPMRGPCIHACGCDWFLPIAEDAQQCTCGHLIHAHVDYLSQFVHHCPTTGCAAYVQKTPHTQDCTCMAPLSSHFLGVNQCRLFEPLVPVSNTMQDA